ncbi:glutathione S-transferase family protein [Marivita hallyeonensis]|uniref:Glutathione S-transferase n=1 Tax=Marivita hallyeonensis TaxID=996342 RepID=A0A1M5URW6_9RHOB|nr:glutathione S-transferase family protein [Marivita hallyeonensis]SHH65666.1 Glutathione S-transferase [Marivita hallyeonensis]
MLTLITFPEGLDEPCLSPFCLKSMIQLEMSGQDWTPEYTGNPAAGPLNRLPALRTPEGVIPESAFIQAYLEGKGADFYPGMSARRRAQGQALIRMIEEHLRLGLAHDRWLVDANWTHLGPVIFAEVPALMRPAVATLARRQVRAGLLSQGCARMTEDQRMECFLPDLDCLTDHLWETRYLLGDHPTAPDTIAVPVLSMIAGLPEETALRRAVRENPTLMAYIERGRAALYPEPSCYAVAA